VKNVPGASGALAIRTVLQGSFGGQHVLVGTPSEAVLAPLFLPPPMHRPDQLRLLGVLARAPLVLVGPATASFGGAPIQLIAMRRLGRALTCGNIGYGSLYHLAAEDLAIRTGIDLVHVPYRGVAPLLQDLIGGTLDLALLPVAGSLVSLLAEGKLRAHAVADRTQLDTLIGVPTVSEVLQIADYFYENWVGLFVSSQVPGEVVHWLHTAIQQAQQDVGFRSQIETAGSILGQPMALEQLQLYFDEQTADFSRLAQGIRPPGRHK
jgi:tripartite-type tricarboxylate transporter receptor subunit TctC